MRKYTNEEILEYLKSGPKRDHSYTHNREMDKQIDPKTLDLVQSLSSHIMYPEVVSGELSPEQAMEDSPEGIGSGYGAIRYGHEILDRTAPALKQDQYSDMGMHNKNQQSYDNGVNWIDSGVDMINQGEKNTQKFKSLMDVLNKKK